MSAIRVESRYADVVMADGVYGVKLGGAERACVTERANVIAIQAARIKTLEARLRVCRQMWPGVDDYISGEAVGALIQDDVYGVGFEVNDNRTDRSTFAAIENPGIKVMTEDDLKTWLPGCCLYAVATKDFTGCTQLCGILLDDRDPEQIRNLVLSLFTQTGKRKLPHPMVG